MVDFCPIWQIGAPIYRGGSRHFVGSWLIDEVITHASNFGLVRSGSVCSFRQEVGVFSDRKWACLAVAQKNNLTAIMTEINSLIPIPQCYYFP